MEATPIPLPLNLPLKVGAFCLALAAAGCVGGEMDGERGERGGALINGEITNERPEIGDIGGCTATLIRPNLVITAAHCMGYSSRPNPGNYSTFNVQMANGGQESYSVRRIKVFSGDLGDRDVALLQLSSSVPSSVAVPTRVSDRGPDPNEEVTIFGYGCTDRWNQGGGYTKRKATFSYGNSSHLCPGDSGGPFVLGVDGPVFGINSGYYTGDGEDIFGFPWSIKQELEAQLRQWEELDGDPVTRRKIQITNSTGRQLWARCNHEDSVTCSWWTLIQPGQTTWLAAEDDALMIDNDEFGGTWVYTEVLADGENVTVYDNPEHPLYPPGEIPEADPEPLPDPTPDPEPDNDPAPDPGEGDDNPIGDPGDPNDPMPAPDPPPDGDAPGSEWVDNGEAGQAWVDDESLGWIDETPTVENRAACATPSRGAPVQRAPLILLLLLPLLPLLRRVGER